MLALRRGSRSPIISVAVSNTCLASRNLVVTSHEPMKKLAEIYVPIAVVVIVVLVLVELGVVVVDVVTDISGRSLCNHPQRRIASSGEG